MRTVCLLAVSLLSAAQVEFTAFPKHMQLFARDSLDSGTVRIAGTVAGADSVVVSLSREGVLVKRTVVDVSDAPGFDLSLRILAEPAQYSVAFFADTAFTAQADSLLAGDAYILDGQSNAAAETYTGYTSPYIRSFGAQQFDATNIDTGWGTAQPAPQINWQRKNVIGVLGMAIARRLVEDYHVPVAIFNGAVAGTPINYHFRDTSLASIYGRLLYRVVHAGLQEGLRGVIWYQGEASYSGPEQYTAHFTTLHNEWTSDFPGIQRVFVFQIRPGCNYDGQDIIRESHRTLPVTLPDVRVMSTANVPGHDGCHYDSAGYRICGERMARLMGVELYGDGDTAGVRPPDIQAAWWGDSEKRSVVLEWSQAVVFNRDTLGHAMAEGFALGKTFGLADSVETDANARTVTLHLAAPCDSSTVTYTPDRFYAGTTTPYEGPWLFNGRGVGALTFYRFPITGYSPVIAKTPEKAFDLSVSPNPFNARTRIRYPASCLISVYNVKGQKVFSGLDNAVWDAKGLPGGVYLVKAVSGRSTVTRKAVLCP